MFRGICKTENWRQPNFIKFLYFLRTTQRPVRHTVASVNKNEMIVLEFPSCRIASWKKRAAAATYNDVLHNKSPQRLLLFQVVFLVSTEYPLQLLSVMKTVNDKRRP